MKAEAIAQWTKGAKTTVVLELDAMEPDEAASQITFKLLVFDDAMRMLQTAAERFMSPEEVAAMKNLVREARGI